MANELDPTPTSKLALLSTYTAAALPHLHEAEDYLSRVKISAIPEEQQETLEKLKTIERAKCIYNIHYCNAGVGFCFYDSEKDPQELRDRFIGDMNIPENISWRKALTMDKYYPTFEEAVDAEYKRITATRLPTKEEAK